MIDWLKYTFLSFFSVKRASESRKRSFLPSFLCFVLPILCFFGCFYGGYVLSFSSYYRNSTDYRDFLYQAFGGKDAISIKAENDRFYSSKNASPSSEVTIPFSDHSYDLNGYRLVVDTRESKTNYNDFSLTYFRGEGDDKVTISYEEYRKLDTPDQASYSMELTYTEKSLVLDEAKMASYADFLLNQEEKDVAEKAKKMMVGGKVTPDNYNAFYELYVSSYYPSFDKIEKYGNAPTMRTFYLDTFLGRDEKGNLRNDKFFILLDDICFTYFRDNRGNAHNISGYLNGSSFDLSRNTGQESIDRMITTLFSANQNISVFNFFVYAMRMGLILLIGWLAMGIVLSIIGTVMKDKFLRNYFRMINLSGLFFLFPGLLTSLYSLLISFVLSTGITYLTSIIFILSTVFVRALIQLILVYQDNKKKTAVSDATKQGE